MLSFSRILQISRPRFWIYVTGPFLLGLIAGTPDIGRLGDPWPLFWLVAFTLPFNLLIYGLNDIADYETDKLNPKKQGYEQVLDKEQHRRLFIAVTTAVIPWAGALFWLPTTPLLFLGLFFFLSIGYSLPPLRFKARPFLDSFSNVLYAVPGFFAYTLTSGNVPTASVVVASVAWCAAMHAYSAVPDIESDRAAATPTIATVLGKSGTTVFCAVLWSVAALAASATLGMWTLLGAAVYLTMCGGYALATSHDSLMRWYRVFPLVNTVTGALLTVGLLQWRL